MISILLPLLQEPLLCPLHALPSAPIRRWDPCLFLCFLLSLHFDTEGKLQPQWTHIYSTIVHFAKVIQSLPTSCASSPDILRNSARAAYVTSPTDVFEEYWKSFVVFSCLRDAVHLWRYVFCLLSLFALFEWVMKTARMGGRLNWFSWFLCWNHPRFWLFSFLCFVYFPSACSLSHCFLVACGADNDIKPKDPIRCRECGYRIMYKKRTKRST